MAAARVSGWTRSISDLPELHSSHAISMWEDDSDLDSPIVPRVRFISEGCPRRYPRYSTLAAVNAMDTALPFLPQKQQAVAEPSRLVNAVLCLLSLALGCLIPILVDFSKTARAYGPAGAALDVLPYTALSILRAEAGFNVCLGLAAICVVRPAGGFNPLWDLSHHAMMLPLTLVYCIGDATALLAMGSGGGPLYIAAGNSKLLFAAAFSHCLLGKRHSLRQWVMLVTICVAAAAYASCGSSKKSSSAANALYTGLALALGKAALSGFAGVLAEGRYRGLNIWHANTLLKTQSLVMAAIATLCRPLVVNDMPLCSVVIATAASGGSATSAGWCLDHDGWDAWSWAVLFGEIGTGWISVIMVTRMSSIAKCVCKTATAPFLYLLYCVFGWGGMRFEVPRFTAVAVIAACIAAYAMDGSGADKTKQQAALPSVQQEQMPVSVTQPNGTGGGWVAEYFRRSQPRGSLLRRPDPALVSANPTCQERGL